MKVLYLLDSLNRGGAEQLVLDVCRNARANDLDLTFAATGGGAFEEDFKTSDVEFIRLQRRLPIDFRVIGQLRKIVKKRQIEIVHTHQAVEAVHAYLACRRTKTRIVLTHHGYIADAKNLLTLKFLIPRVSANIIVSRALIAWYETENKLKFSDRPTIIYNGVDEKRLRGESGKLKRELGLADDDLLVGMIANFYRDPRKDQMTVCRALPEIFSKIENARCVFVGGVEAGAEAKFEACVNFCEERGIAERVHFLGARRDVPNVLAALDVFVFSSLQEGLPVVAAEAMLARVPLLVSDIEPLLEASAGGRYAEVFQTKNASQLAEKTVELLADKTRREDLANRAFDYAQEYFSIEAHLRELKKLYCSIL
jgi:glycosyltransferase involved in cell wall biosynthesis